MSLATYRKKRHFGRTPEPKPTAKKGRKSIFVVQRHDARRLHYDFRIEVGGTLKSWAIPKGLPTSPKVKRLAVQTEDHPLAYAKFEGEIPEGEYGAGVVKIWDRGKYYNLKTDKNGKEIPLKKCLLDGQIEIFLEGDRFQGGYALIHFRDKNWLMIKMRAKTTRYMSEKKSKKAKG